MRMSPPSPLSFMVKHLTEYRIFDFARWAIPVCLFFSWVYMRTKYHWTQLLGVLICISGLGLLVASDQLTHKDWQALDRAKGDGFMIAGATLYGFSEPTPSSPTCGEKKTLLTLQQLTQLKNSSYASARFTRLVFRTSASLLWLFSQRFLGRRSIGDVGIYY